MALYLLLQSGSSQMSVDNARSRVPVEELANRCRQELIPITNKISYFAATPMAEEDLRQYLHDPIAALSPAIAEALPKLGILLVPFLEKGNGKVGDSVTYDHPQEAKLILNSTARTGNLRVLALAIKEIEVADFHYNFYNAIAGVIGESLPEEVQERYYRIIREELSAEMHGEVDEKSWHLKQALQRRQANVRKETKLFREYATQSFIDTLTLYLHGTCCDIDVETGPRQMPSRYLRRRIEALLAIYPPPEGYAVLPEQLKTR
jgi:hypothetical protein